MDATIYERHPINHLKCALHNPKTSTKEKFDEKFDNRKKITGNNNANPNTS